MNKLTCILIFTISIYTTFGIAQERKLNKGTSKRNIRKRQEEANKKSQYNKFNELQPEGQKASEARTDFIWSYETANTVPERGADISILTPTRYSPKSSIEYSTSLGSTYWIPNIFIKKRWVNKRKLIASTYHGIYYPTLAWNWLQNQEKYNIIGENVKTQDVIAVKNQIILSVPFYKDIKCGYKQPWIIATVAAGADIGLSKEYFNMPKPNYHFIRPRAKALMGDGYYIHARAQLDIYLNENIFATIAMRSLFEDKTYLEQNSFLRFRISPKFTLSAGYWYSLNDLSGTPILPTLDLTWHLGYKEGRQKGLFNRKTKY